nr:expressed protein [Hymenolepis microstoma]
MQLYDREEAHLRFLSLISAITNRDVLAQLHLHSLENFLSCELEAWAPLIANCSYPEGVLCCKNLTTPIGIIPKTRVRETDVIALEIDLSNL